MTFSTRNFDPLTPLAPKFPNFATQILFFRLKHTVAVVTHAHVLQNFYTTWVLGVAWDPVHIFAPLKLPTSNLVHTMGLEVVYQKTTFSTKIGGGLG